MTSGLRRSGTNGPLISVPRVATNSATAFFWASVILSAGIGGIRSCAPAPRQGATSTASTTNRNARVPFCQLTMSTSRLTDHNRAVRGAALTGWHLSGRDRVFERLGIQAVEAAVVGLALRVHEVRDLPAARTGECHVVLKV